jgi:hypothetical protein
VQEYRRGAGILTGWRNTDREQEFRQGAGIQTGSGIRTQSSTDREQEYCTDREHEYRQGAGIQIGSGTHTGCRDKKPDA